MSKCQAQTNKGTRCSKNACADSGDHSLCTAHYNKFVADKDSITWFVTTSQRASSEPDTVDNSSLGTSKLFDVAMQMLPDIPELPELPEDPDVVSSPLPADADIWTQIATSLPSPKFSPPDRKQQAPKRRLTPKVLANLAMWMFYRDCCKDPKTNNTIRNNIVRSGLVKGQILATKDKIVEENGTIRVVKIDIIPFQLVKYATDTVWQKVPEAMRQQYFKAVQDDYNKRLKAAEKKAKKSKTDDSSSEDDE
jgi:hypothetical protein